MRRVDGSVDIYFVHDFARADGQLSLWRVCVDNEGKLGEEELVVGDEVGNIAKPQVFRLPTQALLITFVEQGKDLNNGSSLYYGKLKSDAPCE